MPHSVSRLAWSVAVAAAMTQATPAAAQPQLVLGGFDAARGGGFSLRDGNRLPGLRNAITMAFPGSAITASSTLTPAYLTGINVLLLASPKSDVSAITPLSTSEQTALANFVNNGGVALLFADNDAFAGSSSSNANNSIISPFGFLVTGALSEVQGASVVAVSPVTNGPFGNISTFTTNYPGWFALLGSSTTLATLNSNGKPVLASLSWGTGLVVASSDASYLADDTRTSANTNLILNAIALYLSVNSHPSISIQSISPTHGGNAGIASVLISGTGFKPGLSATLSGVGPDIRGISTVVPASSFATTTFDLTGADPGVRNVVVTNSDNTSITLPNGFTVEEGGSAQLWVDVVGWSSLRAGQPQQYFILVGNRGNLDADSAAVWMRFPSFVTSTTEASGSFEADDGTVLFFDSTNVAAGSVIVIPVSLKAPDAPEFGHRLFDVKVWVNPR